MSWERKERRENRTRDPFQSDVSRYVYPPFHSPFKTTNNLYVASEWIEKRNFPSTGLSHRSLSVSLSLSLSQISSWLSRVYRSRVSIVILFVKKKKDLNPVFDVKVFFLWYCCLILNGGGEWENQKRIPEKSRLKNESHLEVIEYLGEEEDAE